MNKKILVTGAGGYIGSVSTYLLLQNGYNVVAIDNFTTGYKAPLSLLQERFGQDRLTYYELDLGSNLTNFFEKEKDIAAVIHYAASCLVSESIENPKKYFSNNVCATQNFLTYLLKYEIKKLVFSSTCAVYGETEYVPIDEKHLTNPTQPYGASKRMAEQIIDWYSRLLGFQYAIMRYFNVCGASDDGLIGDSKNPSVLLIQNAVKGALGITPFYLTYPDVDTPDKSPIRDYINIVDLNLAHIKALEYLLNGGESQIINIGTGDGNSVLEIVEKVQEITGKKFDLQKGQARRGEYAKAIADINKAKMILDWQPQRSLEETINSLIKWYTIHPSGWVK